MARLVQNIQQIINKLYSPIQLFITQKDKQILHTLIENEKLPDLSSPDEEVKNQTFIILRILSAVCLGIIFFLVYKFDINFKNMFLYTCILLLTIAITDYMFSTFIASKFIYTDANFVMKTVLESFHNQIE